MSEKNTTTTLTDNEQDFIERMKAIYSHTQSQSDHLRELHQAGNREELNEAIDELADTLLENDEEYIDNLRTLKSLRESHKPDDQKINVIIARQRELLQIYRHIISNEAGLPDEARFTEIEAAKNLIAEKLKNTGAPIETIDEALQTLGILSVSEDKKSYSFPDTLVPPSVNEKWQTYLASVCNHAKAVESNPDINNRYIVEEADRTRRYAHDSIATDMHSILGLAELNPSWSFADTRELLAHIRDDVLPTYESLLSDESRQLMNAHAAHIKATKLLSSPPYHH